MNVSVTLRLSAQTAFLGRIHPEMRLIKVMMKGDEIVLTVTLDREPTERIREDISEAATEIIADFPPGTTISEHIEVSQASLPREDILESGSVYQRAESQ